VAGLQRGFSGRAADRQIDKADIEFPNDLLRELDRMEFYVYETRELVKAKHRPIVSSLEQREGAARRVPAAAASFPLHPLPPTRRRWRESSRAFPALKKSLLREAMEVLRCAKYRA